MQQKKIGLTTTWLGNNGDYTVRPGYETVYPYSNYYKFYELRHSNVKSTRNPYGAIYINNPETPMTLEQTVTALLDLYYK